MDKDRILKMIKINEQDIQRIAYVSLCNHIFKYREILNSSHIHGYPNIEDRSTSIVYGILYYMNDDAFEKIVRLKCKTSKQDKKYKYLIKDIMVYDNSNLSNTWNAKTFIIHPLRLGDEVKPKKTAFKHITKTVFGIPDHSAYHLKRLHYITRY